MYSNRTLFIQNHQALKEIIKPFCFFSFFSLLFPSQRYIYPPLSYTMSTVTIILGMWCMSPGCRDQLCQNQASRFQKKIENLPTLMKFCGSVSDNFFWMYHSFLRHVSLPFAPNSLLIQHIRFPLEFSVTQKKNIQDDKKIVTHKIWLQRIGIIWLKDRKKKQWNNTKNTRNCIPPSTPPPHTGRILVCSLGAVTFSFSCP